MKSSYKWQRYSLPSDEYKQKMGLIDSDNTTEVKQIVLVQNKYEKAYKTASDIRKFEIDLFWKRAAFFWAFIAAVYTAYYHVLTKIYVIKCEHTTLYTHGTIPLLVLSGLGLFFCFSWLLSSIGSKHWQENWENHLDLLEDNVTGPLYKTYRAGTAFSESKITIAAGWIVTVCSYVLFIYEFSQMLLIKSSFTNRQTLFYINFSFAVIIAVCLYSYSVIVTGNTNNSDEIEFQIKIYEGFNND